MLRSELRELLRRLPRDATVPAGWLVDQLDDDTTDRDLTLQEVAVELGRAVSTVRSWCNSGQLEGAFKFRNREWRIPASALRRFRQREGESKAPTVAHRRPVDLSSWRKVREGTG